MPELRLMRGVRQARLFWPATAALLACLAAAQLVAAWRESNIGDEPVELAAGYSYLKTGDFRMNPEHPPLAKILAALPLLALRPSLPLDSTFWTKADEYGFSVQFFARNSRSIDTLLFAARLVSIVLTACLGLAIALWTPQRVRPGSRHAGAGTLRLRSYGNRPRPLCEERSPGDAVLLPGRDCVVRVSGASPAGAAGRGWCCPGPGCGHQFLGPVPAPGLGHPFRGALVARRKGAFPFGMASALCWLP